MTGKIGLDYFSYQINLEVVEQNKYNECFLTGKKETIQQRKKKIKLVIISFHVKIWGGKQTEPMVLKKIGKNLPETMVFLLAMTHNK